MARPLQKMRKGISSIEMIIAMGSGAILMAGLSGVLILSSKSLEIAVEPPPKLAIVGTPLGRLKDDLRQAISVETDNKVLRIVVPDRDGDGANETIAYRLGTESGSNSLYRSDSPVLSEVQSVSLRSNNSASGNGSPGGAQGSGSGNGNNAPVADVVSNVGGYGNLFETTLPAYSQPGDLYLVGIAIDTNQGNLVAPHGWNIIQEKKASNGGSYGNGKNAGNPKCQAGLYSYVVQTAGSSTHQFSWNHWRYAICWVMRIERTNSRLPITYSDSNGGNFVFGNTPPNVVGLSITEPNSIAIQFIATEQDALQKYRSGLPAYTDYLFAEQPNLNATVSIRNLRNFTGTIDINAPMLLVGSTNWVNIGAVICAQ